MRDFIEGLMRTHGLTLRELANRLGYSSKTSLERIMDGSTRASGLNDFRDRVRKHFHLCEAEEEALRSAIATTLHGADTVAAWKAIWQGLRGLMPWQHAERPVMLIDVAGEEREIPFLQRYADARSITFTLLGCSNAPLYPELVQMMQREDVHVRHYINAMDGSAQTIHDVYVLSYLLSCRRYEVFACETQVAGSSTKAVARGWSMVAEYERAGVPCEDIILFHDDGRGALMSRSPSQGCYLRLMGLRADDFHPIKHELDASDEGGTLLDYAAAYGELEYDTALWMFKPDISNNYIHPDILMAACAERVPPALLRPMAAIYRERYENTLSKHKQTCIVLKQDAMRAFARTGKTMDHFYLMRPFTPAERVEILSGLLRRMEDDPFFHLQFLEADCKTLDLDITCYEGKRILVIMPDAHYRLSEGMAELSLSAPPVLRQFEQFFREELRANCLSERDSCALMRGLIAISHGCSA